MRSILLREKAIEFLNGISAISPNDIELKKFLYYLECYCAELKKTENDVLLNDENFEVFYSLFDSVMIKGSNKVIYQSYL